MDSSLPRSPDVEGGNTCDHELVYLYLHVVSRALLICRSVWGADGASNRTVDTPSQRADVPREDQPAEARGAG